MKIIVFFFSISNIFSYIEASGGIQSILCLNNRLDCNTVNGLLQISFNSNQSLLASFISTSKTDESTTWGEVQYVIFKNAYIPRIEEAIRTSLSNLNLVHEQIINLLDKFIRAYRVKAFFYCIKLGEWGSVAEYMKCKFSI